VLKGVFEAGFVKLGCGEWGSGVMWELRLTLATKRLNGFFREIEFLENRIFDPLRTTYFNYSTFNVSYALRSTKNASKD
jgi:hypothetical protein